MRWPFFVLVFAIFGAAMAHADEGMWTFDHFPAAPMRAAFGWAPDQTWLDHARLSTLQMPLGCTASFVSNVGKPDLSKLLRLGEFGRDCNFYTGSSSTSGGYQGALSGGEEVSSWATQSTTALGISLNPHSSNTEFAIQDSDNNDQALANLNATKAGFATIAPVITAEFAALGPDIQSLGGWRGNWGWNDIGERHAEGKKLRFLFRVKHFGCGRADVLPTRLCAEYRRLAHPGWGAFGGAGAGGEYRG